MPRTRIFFISESFPPLGRGGALIRASFARCLSREGWEVTVITTGPRKGIFIDWVCEHELLAQLKNEMDIKFVPLVWGGRKSELLFALKIKPSLLSDWVPAVIRSLNQIVEPNTDGMILATYPEIENFPIAVAMKRRFGFPLFLDFRDDNLGEPVGDYLREADHAFAATEAIKRSLIRQTGFDQRKMTVVFNGYLEKISPVPRKTQAGDKLKIIYAGSISGIQKPEILNLAYRRLLQKHPECRGKITIDVYGQKSYYYWLTYRKTLCEGINFKRYVDRQVLARRMQEDADVAFFSLAHDKFSYAHPTKLFDYINWELPVLAALPDGEAKELILKNVLGKVVHFSDVEGLSRHIYDYYVHSEERERIRQNMAGIKDQFNIETQVRKVSQVLKIFQST